ncbi:MAG: translation initiation factor IF-1 [Myxococcota bacterium]
MARDDLIEATGTVDKILGGGRYQITLESGQVVTAQLSGRMRRFSHSRHPRRSRDRGPLAL